ncbi:MAG: amino acid racemase [Bacteroidota bacterium]
MNFGYYNIDMETAPSTRLGIIGGMGSMAGVLLAQKIIRNSPACQDQDHIEFILHNNPLVPDRTKAILKGEQSPIDQLARSVEILDQQNVDLIVMACMTSYYFQEHVMSLSKAQLIRPIEITERHIAKIYPGAQRIGLLASTGTVKSRLFHDQLAASGKEVITLSDYEQENWLMKAIYQKNGLKSGQVSGDSRLCRRQPTDHEIVSI